MGDDSTFLSRRQVLAGTGLTAAAALIGATPARAVIRGVTAAAPDPAPGAREYDFGPDWRFALVTDQGVTDPTGAYANAYQPGFDDSKWRILDVPHDWSAELDPVDAAYTSDGNGYLPGGLGWYRKTFTLPSWMTGKNIEIEFDGVYMNSVVYVNGQKLGTHPYAYTGFSYDLTPYAHTDGSTPNVVAVQASNQIPSSRWYSGSGIYRNVRITVTDPVRIARHGTFITTPDAAATVPNGYATIKINTALQNGSSATAPLTIALLARDASGRTVASGSSSLTVAAGQTQTATTTLRVSRPELWSTENPYLYTLETRVSEGGKVIDSSEDPFGIRYFEFDPDKGFSLNGKHLKLHGVDLHATQGPLGAAIHADSITRQLSLMKSYGVNSVRTAHNPPAPEFTAAAERMGILLMVEAFDCWHAGKVAYDYHLYFDEWSDRDIAEMVLAHRNSPAVILWSIGNETPDTWQPSGPPIAKRLVADVRALDPTRPVVMGSDQYRSVPADGSPQDQIVRELDGLGVNYNTAGSMDGLHAKYGDRFFFCSEMSSETSTRGFYDHPDLLNTGPNFTPGKCETSSYDNNLSSWCMSGEYELKKDRDREFWAGGFLWAGQDYTGEPTPYAQFPVKSSFFGATDTAGFSKDMRYLYESQWSSAPMAHIVPMDWSSWSPGQKVSVWVYANVPSVELFLNGKSLGVKKFDAKTTTFGQAYLETTEPTDDDYNYPSGSYTSPNGSTGKLHLTWSVPYQPGTLTAVARDASGAEVARDSVTTAGAPRSLKLSSPTASLTADGSSLAYVTASVVDSRGVTVTGARNPVRFTVTGAGTLKATDNGRQENARAYTSPVQEAFFGQALAVVGATRVPGTVTLTATADGLAPATLKFRSAPAAGNPVPGIVRGSGAPAPVPGTPAGPSGSGPWADASFSGAPDTVPAAMLDGNAATHWSNYYDAVKTANVNAVSVSDASDWVSLTWASARRVSGLSATFVTGGALALPKSASVEYWNGRAFVPASRTAVTWASASGQPSSITFDPVTTTAVRLTLTSPAPGTGGGFLAIAELSAP